MNVNELYNNAELMEHLEHECKKSYYSSTNWLVKSNYEYEEFVNEVNIYIIKYWSTRDTDYSAKYWIHLTIGSVMKDLYKGIKTQKRGELCDGAIYRIDTELDDKEYGYREIKAELVAKDNFDIHKYIQFVTNMIPNMIDKQICELYLLGYTTIKISKIVGLSARQVRYKVNNKYNKIFQESYFEYKANEI